MISQVIQSLEFLLTSTQQRNIHQSVTKQNDCQSVHCYRIQFAEEIVDGFNDKSRAEAKREKAKHRLK